ncbi:MAG: cysteine synthase A [Ruminococcaceae bacterium]|nr:cysteine synthase A [Oscillospiraceae bacterium]
MAKIYKKAYELIGKTPLLELSNLEEKLNLKAKILAKIESFNPAGSVKDRVAIKMIEDYENQGLLNENSVIIEPTSGNTGIGLTMVCAAKGYRLIIIMPDSMSVERRKLIASYGAELVLTDGKNGMAGAIEKAEELQKEIAGSVIAGQFTNPSNPQAHFETTGPEIYEDTDGNVDIFVAGVGTGGTITGTGKYLKSKNDNIKIVAVEPATSAVLSGEKAGKHGLQGIGAGFIPEVMSVDVIDEIVKVTEEQAYSAARLLGKNEGVLVGISSGAALHAAIKLAEKEENKDKNIVVLLPDTGDRYLSTELFE